MTKKIKKICKDDCEHTETEYDEYPCKVCIRNSVNRNLKDLYERGGR